MPAALEVADVFRRHGPAYRRSHDGHLGRYTHRVAIANSRLIEADDKTVTFRWRDYRHGNAPRLMSLGADEFIRRFLLHSLPDGFHRIRHYGFLANGCRSVRLTIIRQLLAARSIVTRSEDRAAQQAVSRATFDPIVCPCCGGTLRIVATLQRWRIFVAHAVADTS